MVKMRKGGGRDGGREGGMEGGGEWTCLGKLHVHVHMSI